jgi:hypothetical protein
VAVMTCDSDNVANDNMLSKCSKKQNKNFIEFVDYSFSEEKNKINKKFV